MGGGRGSGPHCRGIAFTSQRCHGCLHRSLRSAMPPRRRSSVTLPATTSSRGWCRPTPTRLRPCWMLSWRWAGTTCPRWRRRAATARVAWRPSCSSPGRQVDGFLPFVFPCVHPPFFRSFLLSLLSFLSNHPNFILMSFFIFFLMSFPLIFLSGFHSSFQPSLYPSYCPCFIPSFLLFFLPSSLPSFLHLFESRALSLKRR